MNRTSKFIVSLFGWIGTVFSIWVVVSSIIPVPYAVFSDLLFIVMFGVGALAYVLKNVRRYFRIPKNGDI